MPWTPPRRQRSSSRRTPCGTRTASSPEPCVIVPGSCPNTSRAGAECWCCISTSSTARFSSWRLTRWLSVPTRGRFCHCGRTACAVCWKCRTVSTSPHALRQLSPHRSDVSSRGSPLTPSISRGATSCCDRRKGCHYWQSPRRRSKAALLSQLCLSTGIAGVICSRMRFDTRSEEHTSELQSRGHLVCRLLLEKKNTYVSEEQ